MMFAYWSRVDTPDGPATVESREGSDPVRVWLDSGREKRREYPASELTARAGVPNDDGGGGVLAKMIREKHLEREMFAAAGAKLVMNHVTMGRSPIRSCDVMLERQRREGP